MEPTFFYLGFYFLMSILRLASSKVDGYGGWKNSPNVQYHIQTDEGEERYFKYQTKSGQYRKEKRLEDGTVVGTYGWVDPNGYLRLRDYVADDRGYRIIKSKMVYVGDAAPEPKKYESLPGVTFRPPFETEAPAISRHFFGASANSYLPPDRRIHPSAAPAGFVFPHVPSPTPFVEVSPDSAPRTSAPPTAPSVSSPVFAYENFTPTPVSGYHYPSTESDAAVVVAAVARDSTTRPSPVSGKFAPSNDFGNNFITETEKNRAFFEDEEGEGASYYGSSKKYVDGRGGGGGGGGGGFAPEYDGISIVRNGFRYYLPRHYHEESSFDGGRERAGSFGYVDPFGIRRVIYYDASPGKGFVHRKNNRYVGFDATPYDPRPIY